MYQKCAYKRVHAILQELQIAAKHHAKGVEVEGALRLRPARAALVALQGEAAHLPEGLQAAVDVALLDHAGDQALEVLVGQAL